MRRVLIVLAVLAVSIGLGAPATASNPASSCSGLAASSRAGDAGAQAEVQVVIKGDAAHEGVSPGAIVAGFSQDHLGSAEVCLD